MSTATAIGKLINIVLRPVGVALHRTPPKLVSKPLSVQNFPQILSIAESFQAEANCLRCCRGVATYWRLSMFILIAA
jgi:hypothetical protein